MIAIFCFGFGEGSMVRYRMWSETCNSKGISAGWKEVSSRSDSRKTPQRTRSVSFLLSHSITRYDEG